MKLDLELLHRIMSDTTMKSRHTVAVKYNLGKRAASYYWFISQNYGAINGAPKDERRVLSVGDLHAPFIKEGYLEFCKEIYVKYACTEVVFTGDIIDSHYSSYHETDPDGHAAGEELARAKKQIKEWHSIFPHSKVCIGNHDAIPNRKAMTAGLSAQWIRKIGDVLDTPTWEYAEEFFIDGNKYCHGTGRKAKPRAKDDLISVIQGHYHSESYVEHFVGQRYKIFALQVGCGVDHKAYAMAYGRNFKKMHLNCGVILENGTLPILEYMKL